jgi:hypothetical protein
MEDGVRRAAVGALRNLRRFRVEGRRATDTAPSLPMAFLQGPDVAHSRDPESEGQLETAIHSNRASESKNGVWGLSIRWCSQTRFGQFPNFERGGRRSSGFRVRRIPGTGSGPSSRGGEVVTLRSPAGTRSAAGPSLVKDPRLDDFPLMTHGAIVVGP